MKPIATKAAFRKAVKYWMKWMGLAYPWTVQIHSDWRDEEEPAGYGACASQPDYHRISLYFDRYSDGWKTKEDGKIHNTVRHELFHGYVSELVQFCHRRCDGDKDLEKELESREEQSMPIWDTIEE
jgi:hypothetical protein